MLDCTNRGFNLLEEDKGIKVTMADVQSDDLNVFKMIQRADTMETFQIECRAEVLMLPRVKPRPLYDLAWRSRSSGPDLSGRFNITVSLWPALTMSTF